MKHASASRVFRKHVMDRTSSNLKIAVYRSWLLYRSIVRRVDVKMSGNGIDAAGERGKIPE